MIGNGLRGLAFDSATIARNDEFDSINRSVRSSSSAGSKLWMVAETHHSRYSATLLADRTNDMRPTCF